MTSTEASDIQTPAPAAATDLVRRAPLIGRTLAPVALALIVGFSGAARGDVVATSDRPQFTARQIELIERNETLSRARAALPWAVLRAVQDLQDALPQRDAAGGTDPDLRALERASPEAAHDLFQLIKKAGGGTAR